MEFPRNVTRAVFDGMSGAGDFVSGIFRNVSDERLSLDLGRFGMKKGPEDRSGPFQLSEMTQP
jgi:hypothetical protein